MKTLLLPVTALCLITFLFCGQPKGDRQADKHDKLRNTLLDTISRYKATVGVSVLELESGDTFSINNNTRFAMMSVYKFPLALAVLSEVQKGKIALQQKVFLSKALLDSFSGGALKRQNPGGDFYMSVDSLLMYSIAYSDNAACDRLFQLVGGTGAAEQYTQGKGFPGIHMKYTELEMGAEPGRLYDNSTTPTEMTALLKAFHERKILDETHTKHLLGYMINDSTTHRRILGKLPAGTVVAHKTGTGMFSDTLVNACNDVGIIYLPNGKHLAVAVFVMNAKESYENTERLIAALTKDIFDFYTTKIN